MFKFSGQIICRLSSRNVLRKYSAPGVTVFKSNKTDVSAANQQETVTNVLEDKEKSISLVAAAFASLNAPDDDTIKKPSPKSIRLSRMQQLDHQIGKAGDVNSLLLVAENPIVSRRHALKVVSVLSDWSSTKKVKLSEFEKDPRFLKLCRILARTPASQAVGSLTMAEDLSTVLGITGDDEAARLIANLSLPQMIKVMKALQQKGRRSTPLLRALSYNITKQPEPIDLKKSADLLFSMAALNFPDPVLLDRICSDVLDCLSNNEDKPAVVNSIVVSLGLLRYRHEPILNALVTWLSERQNMLRPADLASAILTLATVNYMPSDSETIVKAAEALTENDMAKSSSWLDLVFSLLIFDRANQKHLESTLQPEFIEKLLSSGEIPIPSRRKLMAIDAYVRQKFPSSAVRLAEDISVGVPIMYTKEKALYVQCIMETFKSLVSADTFMNKECQSGMGFLYDAEFVVDSKCHPVPLDKAAERKDVHRLAVLALDYHDMTRKAAVPLGVNVLYSRLLQFKGYKVLEIPYTEFNPKDKLVARVQFIEKRIKDLIAQPS